MSGETEKDSKASAEAKNGQSIDHHGIEPARDTAGSGDRSDPLRKPGALPLETRNQYTHKKPEKD